MSQFNSIQIFSAYFYTLPFNITAPRAGRSRVRFPMVSLEFFIDKILPAALWPWG